MQLYCLAQMEGKWVSCSSLDRRIASLFFTWVSPSRHTFMLLDLLRYSILLSAEGRDLCSTQDSSPQEQAFIS